MSERPKFLDQKLWKIVVEILLMLGVAFLVLLTVFVWRVHTRPLDISFAKPYVQSALSSHASGRRATMDTLMLHWPRLRGPLLIGIQGVRVLDAEGRVAVSIDEAAIGLVKSRLFLGQIAPSVLIVKQPALRVVREADGEFDFGFGGAPVSVVGPPALQSLEHSIAEQEDILELIIAYITEPGRQSLSSSPLASLEVFKIDRAKLAVDDRVMGVSWFVPRFDATFQSAKEGMRAAFFLDVPNGRDGSASVNAEVVFNAETKESSGRVSLKDFDPRIFADKVPALEALRAQDIVFDADIDVVLDQKLMPLRGDLRVSSAGGAFQYDGVYADPVDFKDMVLRGSYDAASGALEIPEAKITLKDVAVRAESSFLYDGSSLRGPLKIAIDEVEQAQIAPLWPAFLVGDNSEKWIVKNLSNGTFRNSFADMVLEAKKGEDGWSFDAQNIVAEFGFENMTVDYRSPMPPVTKAKGRGTFDNTQEKITVDVEHGYVGGLEVTHAGLEFVEIITKGKGVADISVKLNGPVSEAIKYLSHDPIALQHDFDLSKTQGQTDLQVNINFPAVDDIKTEDVKVRVRGSADALTLPGAVGDLDLAGGPFSISVKDNLFTASGRGRLDAQPVDARYEVFLESEGKPYKAKASATTIATPAMRNKLGVDLSEFLEGAAPVKVEYTEYRDGRSEADVVVDLTSSRFFISPFDYEKPVGVAGDAAFKAQMKNGRLQKITGLKGSAPKFSLSGGDINFRSKSGGAKEVELASGKAARFVVEQSIGKVEFEVSPAGQVKIILDGQVLDLRPFLSSDNEPKEAYDAPPMVVSVAVDKMITHEGQSVQYGKIYVDIDDKGRFNQLEMDGVSGAGDIYLRYKPDDTGKRVFRFEADDAGATLKAFGLYDKIVGGKMSVYGEPIKGVFDRNLLGAAEIADFKVVNAPSIARLLGAMSLPGAMDTLNGEGLSFTKLEANFDWVYRRGGSMLVLKDGRSSGNSLGLTFDGTFDNARQVVDVSGTIVPLSGINNVLGSIPLLGDILTGGSGGVFAATYSVKGAGDNPKISVNPLSVLAPGIVRRILFEQ